MPDLARTVADAPKRLRARLAARLPGGAKAYDAAIAEVLGVPGSPSNRSRPGEPPRRQSGKLLAGTKAIADPADLSVRVVTTRIGTYLNGGTSRMAARPFARPVMTRAIPGFRRALFAK